MGDRMFTERGVRITSNPIVQVERPEGPDPRRVLRVPVKIPMTDPRSQYLRYRTLLRRLDIRAKPDDLDPIAAFLVVCAYSWNTIADWRDRRNLVAAVVAELRGVRRIRLAKDGVARVRLIAKIKAFRDHSTFAMPKEILDLTIKMLEAPPEDLAKRMLGFVHWLQEFAHFAPPVEIPDITAFVFTTDQWRSTQARPSSHFGFTLIELLNHAYGSQKGAVKDADRILAAAFGDVPGLVPDGTAALSRARWRLRSPWNRRNSPFLRFGTWRTYAHIARQLTRPPAV